MSKGWVYFIRAGDEGPIKIGFSSNAPLLRLEDLQTAHYENLRVIGSVKGHRSREAELHDQFSHLRIRGEWFRSSPELEAEIERLQLDDEDTDPNASPTGRQQ